MAGLSIIGTAQPINVKSDIGKKEEEPTTIIPGTASAFTEYMNSVLKKLTDQQAAIDTKTPPRIWVPTSVPILTPSNIVTSSGDNMGQCSVEQEQPGHLQALLR